MGGTDRRVLAVVLVLIIALAAFIVLVGTGIIPTQNPYYQPPTHYNPNLAFPTGNVILNATEYHPEFVEPVDGTAYTACVLTERTRGVFDWLSEHNISLEAAPGPASYCIMSQSTLESLQGTNFTKYIEYIQDIPVEPKFSYARELLEEIRRNPSETVAVCVYLFDGVDQASVEAEVLSYGERITEGYRMLESLCLYATGTNVLRIAAESYVKRITPTFGFIEPLI